MTATATMIHGAFILKIKTPKWQLCAVKEVPEMPASSWMLFGKNKSNKEMFQMEFKSYEATQLINHLVNMTMTDAEIRLVLVAESPAISCIESLWALKGLEMYRDKPKCLPEALQHAVQMLSLSPQMLKRSHKAPYHSMQTRSKASRH
jgi:hypothetical protein